MKRLLLVTAAVVLSSALLAGAAATPKTHKTVAKAKPAATIVSGRTHEAAHPEATVTATLSGGHVQRIVWKSGAGAKAVERVYTFTNGKPSSAEPADAVRRHPRQDLRPHGRRDDRPPRLADRDQDRRPRQRQDQGPPAEGCARTRSSWRSTSRRTRRNFRRPSSQRWRRSLADGSRICGKIAAMKRLLLISLVFLPATIPAAKGLSRLESDFAAQKPRLQVLEGSTDEPSCSGTWLTVYTSGPQVRKLEWEMIGSQKILKRDFYFSQGRPELVVERTYLVLDNRGERVARPRLESVRRIWLTDSKAGPKAKADQRELRRQAAYLTKYFRTHPKEFDNPVQYRPAASRRPTEA